MGFQQRARLECFHASTLQCFEFVPLWNSERSGGPTSGLPVRERMASEMEMPWMPEMIDYQVASPRNHTEWPSSNGYRLYRALPERLAFHLHDTTEKAHQTKTSAGLAMSDASLFSAAWSSARNRVVANAIYDPAQDPQWLRYKIGGAGIPLCSGIASFVPLLIPGFPPLFFLLFSFL